MVVVCFSLGWGAYGYTVGTDFSGLPYPFCPFHMGVGFPIGFILKAKANQPFPTTPLHSPATTAQHANLLCGAAGLLPGIQLSPNLGVVALSFLNTLVIFIVCERP